MTKRKTKKKINLKKLAVHDTLWHEDSRLVFKSKTQKLVVGILGDDDKSIVVNDETLDLCEKWGFKIDPTLVESESDNEEVEHPTLDSGDHEQIAATAQVENKEDRKEKLREDVESAVLSPTSPSNVAEPRSRPEAKPARGLALDGIKSSQTLLDALSTVSKNVAETLHHLESKVSELTVELAKEKKARKESDEKLERIRRQFFD
jgi:hypothetical protein